MKAGTQRPISRLLAAVALLLPCMMTMGPPVIAKEALPVMRISTENAPHHVHSRVVAAFAEALRQRVGNRLEIVHEDSARLFRDREVIHALQQGQVEMAVPGTWQLDRFEPMVGVFLLPAFYGLDAETNYHLRDGAPGQRISRALEERLGVVVPGRWIDLGFAHIYTRTPVTRHEDLNGLTIRSPGGEANAARLSGLGMTPVVVPWPEVPEVLDAERLDGVLTTHETFASAALWDHGLRYAFEDQQYFAQYIPIISGRFWNRLSPDLQQTILEVWDAQVNTARAEAAQAQRQARQSLLDHGVVITTPDRSTLTHWRTHPVAGAMPEDVLRSLGLDPAFVIEVIGQVERSP